MEWLAELLAGAAVESWPRTAAGLFTGIAVVAWLIYMDFSSALGRWSVVVVPPLAVAVLVWSRRGRAEA